jgi:hypothetical protein
MKFTELSFTRIKGQIEDFLKTEYGKANILFSRASPYGQILSVIENLHQLSMMYLKNILNSFDINNNSATNNRVVRNTAIFAGHNIGRAISATGTIKLSFKTEKDVSDIGSITFNNKMLLKNDNNSLFYSLNLGQDFISLDITKTPNFTLNIIQGKWILKTYTGSGEALQTISITEIGNNDIENFNVQVIVNGEFWIVKKHLYDMIPDEMAIVVKTGLDGGVDIIFGNGSFGRIPRIGSVIEVYYLQTKGSLGNVYRKKNKKEWKFVDDVFDKRGDIIRMDEYFNIETFADINYGADAESIEFTRSLLPISSNNYVLANPQQYAYHIKKLGVFSHVNAYEKNGTINISVTPNINLFKNKIDDYFTIDISAFTLDQYEKNKIDYYLRNSGIIQLTRKYKIVNPVLSHYIINIFIVSYSDTQKDSLESQIKSVLSDYFLNIGNLNLSSTRVGNKDYFRIAKVDVLKQISNIPDIHSVDIQFISKNNEDYHRNGNIEGTIDYDPKRTIGLDPILGDILFEANELPIIRGGWANRNNITYDSDINSTNLKSLNVINNGTVDSKKRDNK